MSAQINGYDFYYRATDAQGKTAVRETRVWDKELFLASLQEAADKENAKQDAGKPRRAAVQQITQEQYRKERG